MLKFSAVLSISKTLGCPHFCMVNILKWGYPRISPLWYYFIYYYYLPVESPTQTDICEINWKIFSFDDNTIVGEIAEIQIDFDQRSFHICLPFLSNIISTSTSHVSIFKGQLISKGLFVFFQFSQKTNEKFLPQKGWAKFNIFKFAFWENWRH